MERLNLRRRGEILETLRLNEVDADYPFMLVQSQADSERILEAALAERDVVVERGVEATSIRIEGELAHVGLTSASGEETAENGVRNFVPG